MKECKIGYITCIGGKELLKYAIRERRRAILNKTNICIQVNLSKQRQFKDVEEN